MCYVSSCGKGTDHYTQKRGEGGEKIGFSGYRNVVNTFTQSDEGKPKKQSQAVILTET